jgi:hypothetical protein
MVARAPATDDAPAPGTAWITTSEDDGYANRHGQPGLGRAPRPRISKEARKGSRGIRELARLEGKFEDRSVIAISDGCHLN